jgi:hypothetical protein
MAEGVRGFEVGPDGEMSAEEHRRFIEFLREGVEDLRAGRVVASEELEVILEEARAKRLARRSERTPAK